MRNIDKEIAKKQQELDVLLNEKKVLAALTLEQQVAEFVHEMTCRWNHTDGCSWFYFSWSNPCNTHNEYLQKARKLMAIEPDFEKIKLIFLAMKG